MMIKRLLLVLLLVGLLSVSVKDEVYPLSINIDPPFVNLKISPGGSTRGVIKFGNGGSNTIGVRVYVQDWVYDPRGNKIFQAPGSTKYSCSDWVSVYPDSFDLPGGEKREVFYTISVPGDAEGGYVSVIFFEAGIGERATAEGSTVRIAGRMGTIIYQETIGKSVRKGSIDSVEIPHPDENRPLDVLIRVKNEGSVHIVAKGDLNIVGEDGTFYGRQKIQEIRSLPGDIIEGKVAWVGQLPEGKYFCVVTLDIGTDVPMFEEVEFAIENKAKLGKIKIEDIKEGGDLKGERISLPLKNTGNLNIKAEGEVLVLDSQGKVVKTIPFPQVFVLPNEETILEVKLKEKLPAGEYQVKANVTFSGRTLTARGKLILNE